MKWKVLHAFQFVYFVCSFVYRRKNNEIMMIENRIFLKSKREEMFKQIHFFRNAATILFILFISLNLKIPPEATAVVGIILLLYNE